ncbi:hypothetical protein [Staphylococcus hominis]|uniref:hypothetical protein n=1 Tax=Staphylococcus hominis TaxID=1290 RepID=UPI002879FCC6|nr:hypothetical protein [Staphylococcus hominis]MDS3918697.1 hypothetical protein [Staphylococcus hominis]
MIKRILINLLFAELLYLLIKPIIIKLESEDDIDTAPADYALNGDQADIDIAFRENKASNVSKPPHLGIKWSKE